MNKLAGPLALILILVVLVTALVAVIWTVTLPGRVLAQLADTAEAHDLELSSSGASFAFDGGPSVVIHNVAITSPQNGLSGRITSLTAQGLMPWGTRSLKLDGVNFTHKVPLATLAVAASKTGIGAEQGFAFHNAGFSDGRFRLVDNAGAVLFDVAGASGAIAALENGGATFNGRGGINGRQATWRMELENLARLGTDGTPADVFIASGDVAQPFDLQFSGRMRLVQGFELDGRFSSAASDARSFLTFLGFPDVVPVHGALAAEGGISLSSRNLKLIDVSLAQGEQEGKGRLALSFGNDGYTVDGAIELPVLNLPSPKATDFWSDRPFALPDFSRLKGAVDVRAQLLAIDSFRLESPRLALRFDGAGASAALSAVQGRDQLSATLRTAAREPFPVFSLSTQFALAEAGPFMQAVSGQAFLHGGLTGKAEISATGKNFAELLSNAAGSIELTMKRGGIDGYALRDMLAIEGTGWRAAPGDKTEGIEAEITAAVGDGIAVLKRASVAADGTRHSIAGEVDFLRKGLALDVTPQGGKRMGVFGPWSQPVFGPDVKGAPEPAPAAVLAPLAGN